MPKDDFVAAPMVLSRYTQGFEEIDYSIPLNGPFDVTARLTAIQLEAQAKGCAVLVNVALITLDEFYGNQPETSEGETEDE